MNTSTATTRLKIAGIVSIAAILLLSGCHSNSRGKFMRKRSVVHVSSVGSGERLSGDPVLVRLGGLDNTRR